jgi:hypothetical protein
VLVRTERLAGILGTPASVGQRGRVCIPLEDHDGPGARAGDQPLVCPDVVQLRDSDKVLVQKRRAWCG